MVSPGDRIRRALRAARGVLAEHTQDALAAVAELEQEPANLRAKLAVHLRAKLAVHGINDIAKCAHLRDLEDFNRAVMAAMQLKTYHEWRAAGRQVKLGERGHRVAPGLVGFTEDQTIAIDYSMGDNRDWDSDISDEEQLAGSDYFNDIGSR